MVTSRKNAKPSCLIFYPLQISVLKVI